MRLLSWTRLSDFHFHFQVVLGVKNLLVNVGDIRYAGSIPRSGRSPEGGHGNPLLPGESHGQRSLVGYSPMGSQRIRHN